MPLTGRGCAGGLGGWPRQRVLSAVTGELSRLRAVVGGDARLLLVMGDAGVGKTRLVTEGMRRVAVDGVVSIWGGCLPMRETLPLLPVADALGELCRVDGGDLLEAALAMTPHYVRAEVERLLPQLGSGAAESSGRGEWAAGPVVRRDRGAAARVRPGDAALVLVVEDVHWADTATLDCLTFLTRAAPRFGADRGRDVPCRTRRRWSRTWPNG